MQEILLPQRLSKKIASTRLYSRRKAEELIKKACVSVNNILVTTPSFLVNYGDKIKINGQPLNISATVPRIWLFNKPKGVLTTKHDPSNRTTIYHLLPKELKNTLYVGRLDFNSEGLLLLTNDGNLSNFLTSAKNNIVRIYKVKTYGKITQEHLNKLKDGITIKGINYRKIVATIIMQNNLQTWINFSLLEGKNNEIRKICTHFNLQVSRLIRTHYGPFALNNLVKGNIKEVSPNYIKKKFSKIIVTPLCSSKLR